jgi:hypothetical protein
MFFSTEPRFADKKLVLNTATAADAGSATHTKQNQ